MKNFSKTCIVDDDAIVVFSIKRAMQAMEFPVEPLVYENGLDAIESFQQMIAENMELPSLILIDINMPVMGGWDFISEMRGIWPKNIKEPIGLEGSFKPILFLWIALVTFCIASS